MAIECRAVVPYKGNGNSCAIPLYKDNTMMIFSEEMLKNARTLKLGSDLYSRLVANLKDGVFHERISVVEDEDLLDGVALLLMEDGTKSVATEDGFWNELLDRNLEFNVED